VLTVTRAAAEAIRRGHPWVYRAAIVSGGNALAAGAEVTLQSNEDERLARGLYDPGSPLAVRVYTEADVPIDAALFSERIQRAALLRRNLFDTEQTNAYRLIHGEGDRLPGFVVDRYATVAVLRLDGDAALARVSDFVTALREPLRAEGIETLVVRKGRGAEKSVETAFGPKAPDTIEVREHAVPFVVDLARGQKTGAFLDQRESRRRVRELARGRRTLNLFSYAGGFSLYAAVGGATEVTSVDIAAAAHATAQESFRRASIDPRAHRFVAADCFAFLAEAARKGETWDLVISDPPSFAPNEKSVPRALAAYRQLHRACVAVLAPSGIFCAGSCSSHVDASAFASTLDDAALGRADLRLLELFGPPADHPTLPAWPEGRYLKFAVLA
jgi:23S rRNA (cytosine1962-C5)-methyltransferase